MRPAGPIAAFLATLAILIAGVIVRFLGPEVRWTGNLVFACLCLASGGFATWLWRGTAAGARVRARAASLPEPAWDRAMLAAVGVFALLAASLSVLRWAALSPVMWDLGNFDQPLWNASRGHGLELTQHAFDGNLDRMSSHFEPILYPISLLYRIHPSPLWILFLQVLCLAGTALILNRAFRLLVPAPAAFALGTAFLLMPSLHFTVLTDFHTDSPAMLFLSLALLAALSERWGLYAAAVLGALLCKEYAALVTAMLGLWVLLVRRRPAVGLLTVVVSAAWFYVAMEVVMPHYNRGLPSGVLLLNYDDLGARDGLKGMVIHLIAHPGALLAKVATPGNLENLVYLFAPLLGLPFLALPELVIAAPIFAKDLMASFDIGNHHLAMSLPFLSFGLARAAARRPGVLPALLGALACGAFLLSPAPPGQRFWRSLGEWVPSPGDAEAKALVARVPPEVPVSASPHLTPRLTHRRFCYLFPAPRERDKVDWVILDFGPELPDASWTTIAEARDSLETLKRDSRFELVERRGDLYLFHRRGAGRPVGPDPFPDATMGP